MRQQAEAAGISCVLPSSDNEPVLQRVTIHEDQQSDHSQSDASTNGEIDETFIKADNAGSNIQSLTIPRQTEVSVRRVDLTSSVGTLKASRIQLILMCSRCKNRESEVFAVKAGQTTRIKCSKCHGELSFAFEPCVIHSNQGGNIICWLKLDGCIAFDLVLPMAEFYANCLECSCDNPVGVS